MFNPGELCVLVDFMDTAGVREGPWGGKEISDSTSKDIFFVITDDAKSGPYSVKVLAKGGLIGWMSSWDLKCVL